MKNKSLIIGLCMFILCMSFVSATDYTFQVQHTGTRNDSGTVIKIPLHNSSYNYSQSNQSDFNVTDTATGEALNFFVFNPDTGVNKTWLYVNTTTNTTARNITVTYGTGNNGSYEGVFKIYDDFNRPNSATVGNALIGGTWTDSNAEINDGTVRVIVTSGSASIDNTSAVQDIYTMYESWTKTSSTSVVAWIQLRQDSGYSGIYSDSTIYKYRNITTLQSFVPTITRTDGSWYEFGMYKANISGVTYYMNDSIRAESSYFNTSIPTPQIYGVYKSSGSGILQGDNVRVYSADPKTTFVYGAVEQAGPPAPTPSNDSVESTAILKQTTPVTVNSATLTTVASSNFEIILNNTALYGSYVMDIIPNNNNVAYCEIQIDGNVVANETRSNVAGVQGSFFLMGSIVNLTNGTHSQQLKCSKTGLGVYIVNNSVGIGHLLVDENNNTLNYDVLSLDERVTSGSDYTRIGQKNFTITNNTLVDLEYFLVVEWSAEYTNNHTSTERLYTYLEINNTNCSIYPRDVNSGSTGSVGGDCLLGNVSAGEEYTINIYGNGTNSTYNMELIFKEFVLGADEIIGGAGALVGKNFTGDTDTLLYNVTGGNMHHALTNVFQKQAYSILTNASTNVNMYITLNNSVDLRSVDMRRDYTAGTIGVMIGQDIFENVPQDNYTISVYGNCGTTGAYCEIMGGAGIGYITDVTTSIQQGFYINASDIFNGSTITNFSAVDGVTFSSNVNGTIFFFTNKSSVNFTLIANNYFNYSVVNHNTSNNLSVELNQSKITFYGIEKFTNTTINNFNITTNYLNLSTTTGSITMPFSAGTQPYTFLSFEGYRNFSSSINVSILQISNTTIQVGNSRLNVTVLDIRDNSTINNFTVNMTDVLSSNKETNTTTLGIAQFFLTQGRNATFNVTAEGYANNNNSKIIYINETEQSVVFYLYQTNTLNVTFRDHLNLSMISGPNITLEIISDTVSGNYTTNNGTLYIPLLEPETYTLRYNAINYSERFYYLELINGTFYDLDLYMIQSGVSENITVTVVDQNLDEVSGAKVKALRYDLDSNTYILQEIGETNVNGQTTLSLTLNDEFYKFMVEVDGVTKLTTTPSYISATSITLQINLGEVVGAVYSNYLSLEHDLSFNTGTNNFRLNYNDASGITTQVCLEVSKFTTTTQTVLNTTCSTSASATILIGVTPLNNTLYVAKAKYKESGTSYMILDKLSYYFSGDNPLGALGVFLQAILTVVCVFIGIWSLPTATLMTPLSLILGRIAGLNAIDYQYLIPLMTAGFIIAILVGRKR